MSTDLHKVPLQHRDPRAFDQADYGLKSDSTEYLWEWLFITLIFHVYKMWIQIYFSKVHMKIKWHDVYKVTIMVHSP